MKFVLVFLAFVAICAIVEAAPTKPVENEITVSDEEWEDYKQKFNKTYKDAEEDKKRREIYLQTKKTVHAHNKRYDAGEVTYTLGINQFADLTQEEFSNHYLNKVPPRIGKK